MENKGLLFIPDISGFTQFINEMEIEHSRLIIQELLELLINANQLQLVISEIEGDAILFYKFGQSPSLDELYKQVKKMFCDFHNHLSAYEYRRFCQCPACSSAINLTLKVVTHYGEFTSYNVKNFEKLIGKDVITAHQLLKNDIDQHEYWLLTKGLVHNNEPEAFADWMQWNTGSKQTDSGTVTFHYTQLGYLKHHAQPGSFPRLDLSKKVKVLSFTRDYDTDIITLFHATGDFRNRSSWQDGVKAVEEVDHILPRVGMRCRCVHENGEVNIYSSSCSFHPDKIQFSETDDRERSTTYYVLEKLGAVKSKLTIEIYVPWNIRAKLLFNLTRKRKMQQTFNKSLHNLEQFVKEITWVGKPSQP
jgi:hypothetical protein